MPDPIRAAVYARFSTDLQNEKSADDQIVLCRTYAANNDFQVVAAYDDKAKSGASMFNRDGLLAMLADAKAGKFKAIIVEHLDRLSRDMADLATIKKQMDFLGVSLIEVHGGEANSLIVGLRAIIAQQFREDNVHKVRRGMQGVIRSGRSAGGKAYGYTPDPGNRGVLEIVPEEAEVVLRIYQEYHDGKSPKAICRDLNADGVPAPRGKLWAPSALIGSADRGSGILRNPQYKGKPIWGKNQMVKNPDTGKRVSRSNPESERLHQDAPHLEIVPPTLFDAVQEQLEARSTGKRSGIVNKRRPVRLLSGLIKCGACGHGMAVAGTDKSGRTRIRCSAHTNSGACPDHKTFYLADVEALVIDTLVDELATEEQVNRYAKAWLEGRHKEAAKDVARRAKAETRKKAIGKELDRINKLLAKGIGDEQSLDAMSKELRAEHDQLQAQLDKEPPASNVVVHPAAVAAFAERLKASRIKLETALHLLEGTGDLHRMIREVVASVTLYRDDEKRMVAHITTLLDPFTAEGTAAMGKIHNPEGGCQVGSGGGT
ncbi:MAG TPA: recombinase family protein [Sphingomonadaceae bacterium]|nr:recombinase family protein [Sphingomonadaceae bacterium]